MNDHFRPGAEVRHLDPKVCFRLMRVVRVSVLGRPHPPQHQPLSVAGRERPRHPRNRLLNRVDGREHV